MPNSEFIQHWNCTVDFQITENNLRKPDENFVFKALISLLKLFNYDTNKILQANTGTPEEKLMFKIEFCGIIEKYYSFSDKKLTFCYLNLIQPSPKKTVHLLKYLLNYHVYCQMFRKEIFSDVEEAIQKHENFKDIVKVRKDENESIERKLNMINQKLNECYKILPELNETVDKIHTAKGNCEENIEKFEENLRIYTNLLIELQSKKEELRSKTVSDNEIEELLIRKASLQSEIKEQLEIECVTRESNQEISKSIQKLENDVKSIELVLEKHSTNLDDFLSSKELGQTLIQLKNDLNVLQVQHQQLCSNIELISKQLNDNDDEYNVKKDSYEKQLAELKEELLKIENVEKTVKNINDQLNKSINELNEKINKEVENYKFMLESSQKMFDLISSELLMDNDDKK